MSEELLQRGLLEKPDLIGDWHFYNIGATTLKTLKDYKILKKISYPKFDRRKPDALIVNSGDVIAVVSNKLPQKLSKDKEVADWIDVTLALQSKLLIITDVKTKTFWVNALTGKSILDENGNELSVLFDPQHSDAQKLIKNILESITESNNQLRKPELKDPTKLAQSVWQDIWSASGDDAEVCLYTFVELFIFKYLSDLNVLSGSYNFDNLLKRYSSDTSEQVLDYYATTIRKEIKKQFQESTDDKTTIINGSTFVNKKGDAVSGYATVFKRILSKFSEYENEYGKFDHIHYEFKSKIFETFLKENISKKNWGQYFTPLKVVRAITKMAKSDIRENISICDPACGVGKFLLEVIAENPNKFYYFDKGKLKRKIKLTGYDKGFEDKEMKTIILAKANMLIYLSNLIREHSKNCKDFSDLFNDTFKLQTTTILGTLYHKIENEYDLILTNPPYVVDGVANIKDEIKHQGLQAHYSIGSLGIEGLFIQWIIKALKPDGKAFIIIPSGTLDRIPDKPLREFIQQECFIDAIVSLPSKTFFTTTKKTFILAITKKHNKALVQKEPVFTYLASSIGETLDINRFEIPENDLDAAANLFNQFKNDKEHFKTKDKRCKIQPAKRFTGSWDNWDIDRMWTNDEKISLGIIEKKSLLSIQEYVLLMSKYSDRLQEQEKELTLLFDRKGKESFKEISILDKEFFELTRGKRITKTTINHNKGAIPVYSSSQDADSVLGYISESYLQKNKLRLFDAPAILFNIDGSVGYCFIRTDKKYSFIDVVAAVRPLSEDVDLNYLKIQLENEIALSGATYQNKLYFGKIKNYGITIKLPIKKDGSFDLALQKELSEKYQLIKSIKSEMQEQTKYLVDAQVSL